MTDRRSPEIPRTKAERSQLSESGNEGRDDNMLRQQARTNTERTEPGRRASESGNEGRDDNILRQQARTNTERTEPGHERPGVRDRLSTIGRRVRDTMKPSRSSGFEGPSTRPRGPLTRESISRAPVPDLDSLRERQEPIPKNAPHLERERGKQEFTATAAWDNETVKQSLSQLRKLEPNTQDWNNQSADLLVTYQEALELEQKALTKDGKKQLDITRHLDSLSDALKGGGSISSEVRKSRQEGELKK